MKGKVSQLIEKHIKTGLKTSANLRQFEQVSFNYLERKTLLIK